MDDLTAAIHERIAADLRRRIAAGEWVDGEMLPARGDLAWAYGVALGTLQRAIRPLIEEGLLHAEDKRGTFVAARPRAAPPVVAVVAWEPVMVADDPDGPWAAVALGAIERAVASGGGRTLVFNAAELNDLPQDPGMALAAAVAARPAALVVFDLIDLPGWPEAARQAWGRRQAPLVYISSMEHHGFAANLTYDNLGGGELAVRHLIANGYRRCAFISPTADEWAIERAHGASYALSEIGAPPLLWVGAWAVAGYGDFLRLDPAGRRAALAEQLDAALKAAGKRSLGLVAANDATAVAIAALLRERGLAPGRDVGLIGFDNDREARLAGLSTVAPPLLEFGAQAAALALGGVPEPLHRRLGGQVLARASTWPRAGR